MNTPTLKEFLVQGKLNLNQFPTKLKSLQKKGITQKGLKEICLRLSELQDIMYAHNRYGVLVCIQGMDTAGKDSLVREVFRHFNARGVVVNSYKAPTRRELLHDYLWRHYIALPERGKFAVFNRSHYENVLVTRANPHLLLKENLPNITKVEDVNIEFWHQRLEQIRNFEKHVAENGTIILKFFLHISKEEQRLRLIRRLDNEKYHWKFLPSDITERKLWDSYMTYYEEAMESTSSQKAPWFVIPADDRLSARYLVAKILLETLQAYTDIKEPKLPPEIEANLNVYRDQLSKKVL
jgi:PPK2 family polyphosphate:nucleotide phosphotransferase